MLKYCCNKEIDKELLDFRKRQVCYNGIEGVIINEEYLIEDMQIPPGFDETSHYIYRIYYNDLMIGLIDYQTGYRYSMLHDDDNIWIGLFLVDENYQRKGLGTKIINQFIEKWQSQYKSIQLACIKDNQKGLAFWHSLGFEKIGCSKYRNLDVIVLQRNL